MRHIKEVSHVSDLVFTDAFSVQALSEDGSEMWSTTFPNMLIQGYFAFNDSFVFIRNSRSVTADQQVITDGVNLLPGGGQKVENHVVLALLFSPVRTHPQFPLLSNLPIEEIDRIPAKGVTSSDTWPITRRNLSDLFPFSPLPVYQGNSRGHSFGHDSVIVLAMLGIVFILYLIYRWATWFLQQSLPREQEHTSPLAAELLSSPYPMPLSKAVIPEVEEELESPAIVSPSNPALSAESAVSIPVSSADFKEQPANVFAGSSSSALTSDLASLYVIHSQYGDIPVCTGLYRQDFKVVEKIAIHV